MKLKNKRPIFNSDNFDYEFLNYYRKEINFSLNEYIKTKTISTLSFNLRNNIISNILNLLIVKIYEKKI